MPIIETKNLRKEYGDTIAVRDISFEVEEGEIFGIVGPNGTGKTTTIEMMEGIRTPDNGEITILGLHPIKDSRKLRQRIGMQLQHAALPERLKVWEAFDMFSQFYEQCVDAQELLESVQLSEKRDAYFSQLSGGQKQRLFVALALINDPQLVFLDELTTGLDPHARRSMWDMIAGLRERGKTVVLSTHYMEEAEFLCDRVAIFHKGELLTLDSVNALIDELNEDKRVEITLGESIDSMKLKELETVTELTQKGVELVVRGSSSRLVVDLVETLVTMGAEIRNLRVKEANLEDVFLTKTGSSYRTVNNPNHIGVEDES